MLSLYHLNIITSESRLGKDKLPPTDVSLTNYSYELCLTECNAGGTLIYIRNHLACKTKNELNIYKSFELESTFTEICNLKKTNIITDRIHTHLNMNVTEFNDDHLNEIFDKLSKENKTIFIFGDFNINLLNYDTRPPTNKFLDLLYLITLNPIYYSPRGQKGIQKNLLRIFSLIWLLRIIFGNIAAPNFDHLPQFIVIPNIYFNSSYPRSNKYERDWSKFDQ